MAVDPGHFLCGGHWHLLQLSRGGDCQLHHPRRHCLAVKDQAWRRIFWMSMPPGILFVVGSLFVAESPRWLFRRGRKAARLERTASITKYGAGHARTGGDGADVSLRPKRVVR